MGTQIIIRSAIGAALMVGISDTSSWAGDPLFMLTHGDQDVLALGTVVAANTESLQFQPVLELPGQRRPLGLNRFMNIGNPPPITIRQADTERLSFYQLPLRVGDRALVSLRIEGNHYRIVWGAFHVSSLDLATLRIANVEKSSDLMALQWYLNSCGKENEFSCDGNGPTMAVQSATMRRPIARQQGKIWVALDHPTATCEALGGVNWGSPPLWLLGMLITIGLLSGGFWVRRSRHT